jgi:TRAP-type C4-dicarboxylate transport system substrate-binding protein
MRKLVRDEEQKQMDEMRSLGIRIDAPDLAPFKAKMGPAYEKIRTNIGAANFDKWMEMAEATK